MVDSEYSPIIRNPETLIFVPGQLKAKKTCKHAVKKLPFLITYIPDWYKTQEVFDIAIVKNTGTLKSVPDCYKKKKKKKKKKSCWYLCICFRICLWLIYDSRNV